jgi:ABC-type antimicrobial peptide transport system permease subunit
MLAIGFGHRSLATLVAGEALITGLAGAVLGSLVAAIGISVVATVKPSVGIGVPWPALGVVILVTAVFCVIAGLIPALRVMRMDCVAAIRAE